MEYLQYDDDELDFERLQFTFYGSFIKAIRRIEDVAQRGQVYDAICDYAFDRRKPDESKLEPIQLSVLDLIFPVLDSARKKVVAGRKGAKQRLRSMLGENSEGCLTKKTSEKEIEKEKEKEIENEYKIKGEGSPGGGCLPGKETDPFDIFWNLYPKKVGKDTARAAYEKVTVPIWVLTKALKEQMQTKQWHQDGGKYIPNPATWLKERRWEDELPAATGQHDLKASGVMGSAEYDAIRRTMAEQR